MSKRSQAVAMIALVAAALLPSARAEEIKGNARAGEQKIAMCVGCHGSVGYKVAFPNVHQVPKLFGQNAAYLSAALIGYRQGERKHPSMRAVAQTLSDQDIADLAAYFETAASGDRAVAGECACGYPCPEGARYRQPYHAQAMEPKGYWSCAFRDGVQPAVARRWSCISEQPG